LVSVTRWIVPEACVKAAVASTGKKKLRILTDLPSYLFKKQEMAVRLIRVEASLCTSSPVNPSHGNASTEDIVPLKLLNLAMLGTKWHLPQSFLGPQSKAVVRYRPGNLAVG
jgi:hypothetical protein